MAAPDLPVALEVSSVARPVRTGIGRYIVELVGALARVAPAVRFDLVYRFSRLRRRRYFLVPPGPGFRTRLLMPGWPARYDRRWRLYHSLDARLPPFDGVPLVATVHDIFSAEHRDFARPGFRARKQAAYAEIARRADRIITASAYTRARFAAHTGVALERIRVVPHGVGEAFRAVPPQAAVAVRARLGLAGPYVLYVGELSRRKNLPTLLRAFAALNRSDLTLVLAGPPSFGAEEVLAEARRLGLRERCRFLGAVPEAELPALYAGAAVHVHVSLDEGFGLPVLEAFACGVPVVASRAGAIPEVAGEAAWLVAPEDEGGLRDALARVLEDRALRERLQAAGRARAAAFTWEAAARRTLQVYREVVPGWPAG